MEKTSLKKNFIMNAILTMSSILFPLISFRYVSQILGPVGTGKVSFATSFITYFNMFAQLGIPTYGIRTCAKVRDDKTELSRTVHELLTINLFLSLIAYITLAVVLLTVPRFQEDRILYVIISSTIILNTIGVEWLYRGLEQYSYITKRSLFFKVVALAAMFLMIHTKDDYVQYGFITILAASASNILNFINMRKYVTFKPVGGYNYMRHMQPIGVFFAMACAATVYTNLDAVMLGFIHSDEEVGYYNAAVKIKTVLVSLVTSLGTVLLPRVSYYISHGQTEEFRNITRKAIQFVFLIATPLMIYFMIYAREGIYLLSGSQFEKSVQPMQVIMPTLLFIGMSNVTGIQILLPLGKERVVLYSEIVGAIVDTIINILLIPKMGATGAAIGTVIAEFAVLVVQLYALRNEVLDFFLHYNYLRLITAIVLSSAACWWVKWMNFGTFVSLLISSICFFSVYLIVLLLFKDPMMEYIVQSVLRRKKA